MEQSTKGEENVLETRRTLIYGLHRGINPFFPVRSSSVGGNRHSCRWLPIAIISSIPASNVSCAMFVMRSFAEACMDRPTFSWGCKLWVRRSEGVVTSFFLPGFVAQVGWYIGLRTKPTTCYGNVFFFDHTATQVMKCCWQIPTASLDFHAGVIFANRISVFFLRAYK